MIRNAILIVALVGANFVLLNWYKNETYKLDTDNSGIILPAEVASQSSGIIPGLAAEESVAVRITFVSPFRLCVFVTLHSGDVAM